jgi:hypothetical protein
MIEAGLPDHGVYLKPLARSCSSTTLSISPFGGLPPSTRSRCALARMKYRDMVVAMQKPRTANAMFNEMPYDTITVSEHVVVTPISHTLTKRGPYDERQSECYTIALVVLTSSSGNEKDARMERPRMGLGQTIAVQRGEWSRH